MTEPTAEGVQRLREALGGRVGLPGSAAYAAALGRVFFPDAARQQPASWCSRLVGNILSVSLLTWVMPVVTRALRFWLVAEGNRTSPRLDALGALVSVGFLTFAAFVFWLCTTQVWHLP